MNYIFNKKETIEKRPLRLLLIGVTGVGSRLGNKLSGKNLFQESDESNSCTKGTQIATNQFGVEIIDSQGLEDTDNEDKEALTSIFNEIKTKNPICWYMSKIYPTKGLENHLKKWLKIFVKCSIQNRFGTILSLFLLFLTQ